MIDSGCAGHLKWQQYIRNLTPRMMDMSVIHYENQKESSKKLLRDDLKNKFEFVDNQVTDKTLDRMSKKWLRKDRHRVKKAHGSKNNPPARYTK